MMKQLAAGAFLAFGALLPLAHAQSPATPVGLWKSIDDDTRKEKSLVRISESGGMLSGKAETLLGAPLLRRTQTWVRVE